MVNLTTNTPAQGRDLAERYDVDFLDGGIMAVPPMIATPAAVLLYSGSRSAFDTNKAVLDLFGESVYVGDDPGFAALHDLSLLGAMYGAYMGVIHAFAMITSAGVSATSFAPMLIRWMTGMTGGLVEGAGEQIDKQDYSINVVSNLAMQTASFGYFFEAAADQGISPELIAPVYPLMRQRVADGHGHEDFAGIIELIRKGTK